MDRLAPARRPEGKPSGTQAWRELLFLHWSVPAHVMRPLVPARLELDTWDGRAWVGLVPFVMRDVRAAWMPRVTALDFLETNVRTYVHHRGEPGVYFFSLDASSWLAVKVARAVWRLPYFHAAMTTAHDGDAIAYRSARRRAEAAVDVMYTPGEHLGASPPGTLEHFLLERYLLYSVGRGDRLYRGQVHHVPYPAQRATVGHLDQTLVAAAGLSIDRGAAPETVHYAAGVDVEVFGPWPVDAAAR